MTPREADVAFVLESVAGVRAVCAIDRKRRAASHFDFAVALEGGGRVLAEAHYALCRVLTHDDCARVFLFTTEAPAIIAEALLPLCLTTGEREAARRRIPPPLPRADAIVASQPRAAGLRVLLVDDDEATGDRVREAVDAPGRCIVAVKVSAAVELAREKPFDLILCDARRAFGLEGLLAALPVEVARGVLILAEHAEIANARWRAQGTDRILTKPLDVSALKAQIERARTHHEPVAEAPPRRRLSAPAAGAPFAALLVDVGDEIHGALRLAFRAEARHAMRSAPEEAAELALSMPFHLVVCSARAALRRQSLLDAIAREDPSGADRVLVVAPMRDVPYVQHQLGQQRRKNTVLALPLDEVLLGRRIFRDHPALLARVAVADAVGIDAVTALARPRFRRIAVLVVDDDVTTQILFAAGELVTARDDEADVALATSVVDALEHVAGRAVDLLVVSGTMRSDGGEPLYRVLWRLRPDLKSRCVLAVEAAEVPSSIPRSSSPLMVERPLTRDTIQALARARRGDA
jgi:DNA-binding response OmpR family regulator